MLDGEDLVTKILLVKLDTVPDDSEQNNSTSSGSSHNSFVGNTPSTVLFFLALAVGVFIAVLFVFFTIRYFIRSKYGLQVYLLSPISASAAFFGGSRSSDDDAHPGFLSANPTDEELYQHIEFIRDYASRSGFIWDRRAYYSSVSEAERRRRRRRRRNRRRRGRFARMKKLTEQEVEILFPRKTYHDWLDGGMERDQENRDGILKEETAESRHNDPESILGIDKSHPIEADITSLNEELTTTTSAYKTPTVKTEAIELEDLSPADMEAQSKNTDEELHFSSGSCAICLDVLDDEDIVRGLICGHVFHAECLDPWLIKRRACCPMCKRDYFFKHEGSEAVAGTGEGEPQSSTNPNATETSNAETAANGQNESDDDDISMIDLEALRRDPAFRAIVQELIPVSERVRVIIEDPANAELRLEERATQISNSMYGPFKSVFWRIMGITKKNLFNWAVMKLYKEHLDSTGSSQPSQARTATNPASGPSASSPTARATGEATAESASGPHSESTTQHHLDSDATTNTNSTPAVDPEVSRTVAESRV